MLTPKELLKPRYKVIADWPDRMGWTINEVITVDEDITTRREDFNGFYRKYPHLFKKLEWWEDRKQKDMPEYVKTKTWVKKVFKWEGAMARFNEYRGYGKDIAWMPTRDYLPATKEEYENQKQTSK